MKKHSFLTQLKRRHSLFIERRFRDRVRNIQLYYIDSGMLFRILRGKRYKVSIGLSQE